MTKKFEFSISLRHLEYIVVFVFWMLSLFGLQWYLQNQFNSRLLLLEKEINGLNQTVLSLESLLKTQQSNIAFKNVVLDNSGYYSPEFYLFLYKIIVISILFAVLLPSLWYFKTMFLSSFLGKLITGINTSGIYLLDFIFKSNKSQISQFIYKDSMDNLFKVNIDLNGQCCDILVKFFNSEEFIPLSNFFFSNREIFEKTMNSCSLNNTPTILLESNLTSIDSTLEILKTIWTN